MKVQRAWVQLQPEMKPIEVVVLAQQKKGYLVQLKSGMKTLIQPHQLVRMIEAPTLPKQKVQYEKQHLPQTTRPILDLHGYTVIEAKMAIDQFLKRQPAQSAVIIIVGKGSGVLKTELTPYLKRHRHVAEVFVDHLRAGFEIVTKK